MRTHLLAALGYSAAVGLLAACDDSYPERNTTQPTDAMAALDTSVVEGGTLQTAPTQGPGSADDSPDAADAPGTLDAASMPPNGADAGRPSAGLPSTDAAAAPVDASVTLPGAVTLEPAMVEAGDGDAGGPDAYTTDPQPETLTAQVHAIIEEARSRGVANGYSVAIYVDDQVVFAEGFGTKNAEGDPVTENTLFQIGSDTKKLTAITVLQSVGRGQLELADSVASQVEDLQLVNAPDALQQATVHDLLTQRSGLFGYTPWFDAPGDEQLSAIARGQFAANEFSQLPAGIAWCYSNAGFSLLGLLVEQHEQRPWATVLSEDVFTPLGLTHSFARRDDMLANEADIASGYGIAEAGDPFAEQSPALPEPGWVEPERQVDNAFLRPAGLVWSTASDQVRLLGFLANGDESVLPDALRLELLEAQVPIFNHSDVSYGYGVSVQAGWFDARGYLPAKVVGHGGTTLNMSSMSLLLPDQHVAVVILANDAGAGPELEFAGFSLLALAAAERLPAPAEAAVAAPPLDDLSVYAGLYFDRSLGDVQLQDTDEGLTITIPALAELGLDVDPVLAPVSLDLFNATIGGQSYLLSFYPGPNDAYEYAVSGLEGIALVRQ